MARQSLPSKENSWRFRIDLAYVGELALPAGQTELSSVDWTKRALVVHGTFSDQPWPGNDSGNDPGLSRTVGSGDAVDTAHTVRLPDVLLCRFFPCDSRTHDLRILPRRQKFSKTRNEMLQLVNFP